MQDSTVDVAFNGVAGIVYNMWHSDGIGAIVQQCLVDNVTLRGYYAAGVVYSLMNYGANQNIVYNSTIIGEWGSAGITYDENGMEKTYATTSENIVMNTTLGTGGNGIFSSAVGWNAASDNFITGISGSELGAIGTASDPKGIQRFFTDSTLIDSDFIEDDKVLALVDITDDYTVNNYWDNIVSRPENPKNSNVGFSTAYLTNGTWTPSLDFWTAKEGYYPYITTLSTSPSEEMRGITGLASVALRPENELENYIAGVKELRLMTYTPAGHEISWNYDDVAGLKVEQVAGKPYKILYTEENATIPPFDLVASIKVGTRSYEKKFENIQILDRLLKEDIEARDPHFTTNNTANTSLLVPSRQAFSRTFFDPIEANPDVIGVARLEREISTGSWILDQSIRCAIGSDGFTIIGANRVELGFTLQAGTRYRMILPEGMVKEALKTNLSEPMEVYFHTAASGAPYIGILNNQLSGSQSVAFTQQQILNGFYVKNNEREDVYIYAPKNYPPNSPANSTSIPTKYTGLWDEDNPNQSMEDALATLSGEGVYYYVANEEKLISSNPTPGTYVVYIMAKNQELEVSTSNFLVRIEGKMFWKGTPPLPAIHFLLTNDKNAILDLAKSGVAAATFDSAGNEIPCLVSASIDEATWESAIKLGHKRGPHFIDVRVYAISPTGQISSEVDAIVRVYLDAPLSYQMTPSPVTMNLSTQRQVEEYMGVQARNFNNKDIIYDHWANNYRRPGVYYVDVTSKPQDVTVCKETNCTYAGTHPKDEVYDTFIVNIIDTPGADITHQWGELTKTLENATIYEEGHYSQAVINEKPTSYLLPVHVPQALAKQSYSKLELSYFNKYRWVFYSDSLDYDHKWSDSYDLAIYRNEPPKVIGLIGGRENGIMFRFEQVGRLFGEVELEFNYEKAKLAHPNLPKENLGLYRYNSNTNKLELVSDIIFVEDGKWISGVIDILAPTTYVIKGKQATDVKMDNSGSLQMVKDFYIISRQYGGNYGEYHQPQDPNMVLVNSETAKIDFLEMVADIPPKDISSSTANIIENYSLVILFVGILIALTGTVIGIITFKKRKGGK